MRIGTSSEFGSKLRQLRQEQSLTQKQVHDQTNIPRQVISDYERGVRVPVRGNMEKLMALYMPDAADKEQLLQEWAHLLPLNIRMRRSRK